MSDEHLYKKVNDELNGKPRKFTDKALWTKAEVISKGDEKLTRYKYIELRVSKLAEQEKLKEEKNQKAEENQQLAKAKEEEKKQISEKKSYVLFLTFLAAFIFGRMFGLLGLVSVAIGYYCYNYLLNQSSRTFLESILGGLLAGAFVYLVSIYLISNQLLDL